MTLARVSVLVPTFNRANYLLEAVNSALTQSYTDLEVVIVDDGSTDNTAEVVRSIQDPRVRYLYQQNRGVSAALNAAWRAAGGEYLALLGSDDVWLPDLLAELAPALDADPELGLIYARAQGMDAQGQPLPQMLGAPMKFPGDTLKSLLYGDSVCGLACLFRRECIDRVGGWDESLIANEDWDIWIRMAQHCRFSYRPEILARYRIHPQNLTGGRSEHYLQLVSDRVRVLDKFYSRSQMPPEALDIKPIAFRNVYMDIAVRHLAVGRRRAAFAYAMRAVRAAPNPLTSAVRIAALFVFYRVLSKTSWGVRFVDAWVARQKRSTS
jgi:glycosyltransferase involved in cell wall biosynthesis